MVKNYYKAKDYEVRRSIGHLLRATSAQVSSEIEALFHERDLTFIQYVILMYLRDGMAKTPADLCQRARYDSGALTRVLDQLEDRKLLSRSRCTQDRRVVKLTITPEGIAIAESCMVLVMERYNTWFEDFTKEEADTLIRLLTKFNENVAQHSGRKD